MCFLKMVLSATDFNGKNQFSPWSIAQYSVHTSTE